MTFWVVDAACRGTDPDIFFPEAGKDFLKKFDKAQQICSICPVQADCLEYALDNNLHEGIWGGLSGNQRIAIKRRRRIK